MASRGGYQRNDIDWICPDPKCGNSNFARRDKCNRCGTGKPPSSSSKVKLGGMELGKQLAEKSKGLFSADDWQCKTCGNVNWARRNTCNVCNTPKVGQVEERTGFGGGFMERDENPEKIQRDSDDDEYDEFGRKKKRYRGSVDGAAASSKPVSPPRQQEEDEDDEDEEEDSDDDDLGKYAFDSDDAEEVKRESAKTKSADRSRSESSRSSYSSQSRGDSSDRSRSRGSRKGDSRARSRSSSSESESSRDRRQQNRSRSRSPLQRR